MRITVSQLIIENGPLLSAMKRMPGFRFCAKSLSSLILPPDYRDWFQVQGGLGKGIWLKLNPRTGSQYYRGQAEIDLQRILRDNLRPGMVFYDLGSNNGFFSLLASRIVGSTGTVIAFEPEPRLGILFRENINRNKAHNIRLVESAVWSSTGSVDFNAADPSASPDFGVGQVVADSAAKTVTVPSICLDDFIQTERPPNLIKCDVEGAEVEVFRGASKLLTEYRPSVECEVHSSENGRLLQVMFAEMHYHAEWISANHLLAVPREFLSRTIIESAR
jgi:FkbM family methyltransferase